MTKKIEASEVHEKTQEFMSKGIASSEKAVEGMIEFNAAMFQGAETMVKKMYDNYVSNVAAAFDGMKSINKSSDLGEYYKSTTSALASAAERMSDQSKGMVELSGKVIKDTADAGRNAFSKTFSTSY